VRRCFKIDKALWIFAKEHLSLTLEECKIGILHPSSLFCNGLTWRMGFCNNYLTAGMQKGMCLLGKTLKQGGF